MDESYSQFKQKFIDEALFLLNELENDLLELENNPKNEQIIGKVFRVMHTLKGVSNMFGYEIIGEFTHHLETLYDLIREQTLDVNKEIIDITLEAGDHLRNLLEDQHLTNENNQEKQKMLSAKVEVIINSVKKDLKADNKSTKLIDIEQTTNTKTYYIMFKPDESIFKRAINILGLFKELSELGQYQMFKHSYSVFASSESPDENMWGIFLATQASLEEIQEVFLFVEDNVRIIKISNRNLYDKKDVSKIFEVSDKATKDNLDDYQVPSSKEVVGNIIRKEDDTYCPPIEKNETPETKKHAETLNSKQKEVTSGITSRISVDSDKLDKLMNYVSEFVITRAELNLIIGNKDYNKLPVVGEKIDKLAKLFRDITLNIRLVPVNDMLVRFKRLIRDLSSDLGKDIEFIARGTDTEMDKNVIDKLADPIMHIIRNSIDHGIETPDKRIKQGKSPKGEITFNASYSGQNVQIEISDDGKGIDLQYIHEKAISKGFVKDDVKLTDKEIYDLIFLPGFSTAQNLTEVSGRGVGMDVVKRTISDLRGEILVESEKGKGTKLTIKLPISLSILDAMLVRISDTYCLVPIDIVESCTEEKHTTLIDLPNSRMPIGEELIPFIYLRDKFDINSEIPDTERIVLVSHEFKKVGLVVDEVIGEHQAVLKPLGEMFKKIDFVSGGSILGNGAIAFVLDTHKLIKELS